MTSKKKIDRQVELHSLYLRNMQRVKWRLQAISEIRSKKKTTTFPMTNIEFCILQMRKILELIAFSSLVSDADVYKEKLGNIERMWNAKLIFQDIERIHPEFYPQAIVIDPNDKSVWKDRTEPCLTKEQFIEAYDKCGRYMHESSPFLTDKQIGDEYDALWGDIYNWGQLIINLLHTHAVKLYNQKDIFYISMGEGDNPPHGNIFGRVEDE